LLVDNRNHGSSQHIDSMSYKEMALDLQALLKNNFSTIGKFTLLGHSMGGKIAMTYACLYPQDLDGLIIIDSAPIDHKVDNEISKSTREIINYISEYNIHGKNRKEMLNDFNNKFVIII